MLENTPRLLIPRPLGNEVDSRAAYRAVLDRIDAAVARLVHAHTGGDEGPLLTAAALATDVTGPLAALQTSAAAVLDADDTTHTASAWNDLSTGVYISLAAGTWDVEAFLTVTGVVAAGPRMARLWNATDATVISSGRVVTAINDTWIIPVPRQIVVLAATKIIALQFYAGNAGDGVLGNSAGARTGIVARRIA